ncbi:MAG: helix-turn-helix domain-containing protein [Actinomycetota bacterium]
MRVGASLERFTCIDAQAEQLTGFDQRYEQVQPGDYSGSFLAAESAEVGVFVERTDRALHQEGAGPSGAVSAVVLAEAPPTGARANGQDFRAGDVLLVGPGGSYDAITGAGAAPAVFSLSIDGRTTLPIAPLANRHAGSVRRVADPVISDRFRQLTRHVVTSWEAAPGSVDVPDAAVQVLMLDLLTAARVGSEARRSSLELFRRARADMVADLTLSRPVNEIAAGLGVSRRTLEHAFDECVDMGPGRFRKLLRLNHARRLLTEGSSTVTQAAMASGLPHLGRFAADYRTHFGELPSNTGHPSRIR